MEAKTSDWRPGPSVCRCCLTEGCYKDISTEYFWMGKKEIYSEMLSDTFSISIAYSQSGPNSNSRLICEPCIARLRDASDFRRQVVECEKTFMQHLDPGTSSSADIEILAETVDYEVKLERVKTEKPLSDDDFDDADFLDDDDDDMDDEPLTKLASKVPKKESVDLLDLLDNSKPSLKRKSATKVKASPTKKSKIKKDTAKPATSKVTKPEKKKKEHIPMTIARQNAKTIVLYTTSYPFRFPQSSIVCVYCGKSFDVPTDYRSHMETQHVDVSLRMAFAHISDSYIKVDISNLRCRICNESFEYLDSIIEHLKSHGHYIDAEHDAGVHPFVFKDDKLLCGICRVNSSNIRSLSRHIHTHFSRCTCDSCGKSYASAGSLKVHRSSCSTPCDRSTRQKRCRKCKKMFYSQKQLNEHQTKSKMCWQHICSVCGERSHTWKIKIDHMYEAHGIQPKDYSCPECDLVFNTADRLKIHFKTTHTNDHLQCFGCDRKFASHKALLKHQVVHTGEKLFTCGVCSKAFNRKSSLTQHMWIHSEVKKHECKMCDKHFNQRVSWKTHMKSRHPELCKF